MATLSNKTYPTRSNRRQVNYIYEYFDYDSCTEGTSSDEKEEIDNVFLNECVDDEINNSDDSQTDMNVENDTDFSSAPAPKKKKNNLKKQQKCKEGRRSQTRCLLMLTIIQI